LRVGRRFEAKKRMREIVFVERHVAVRAQIEIEAARALPAHADDAVLSTRITDDIGMAHADRSVVVDAQIER
jgi:hypothetical protein